APRGHGDLQRGRLRGHAVAVGTRRRGARVVAATSRERAQELRLVAAAPRSQPCPAWSDLSRYLARSVSRWRPRAHPGPALSDPRAYGRLPAAPTCPAGGGARPRCLQPREAAPSRHVAPDLRTQARVS